MAIYPNNRHKRHNRHREKVLTGCRETFTKVCTAGCVPQNAGRSLDRKKKCAPGGRGFSAAVSSLGEPTIPGSPEKSSDFSGWE